MMNAIIIASEQRTLNALRNVLDKYCPEVRVGASCFGADQAEELIRHLSPHLIFIEAEVPQQKKELIFSQSRDVGCEVIITANTAAYAMQAIKHEVSDYLLKPIQKEDLVLAVQKASRRLQVKTNLADYRQVIKKLFAISSAKELVGIPTIEGMEFVVAEEIVRCMGLQKCTRVITLDRTDIVSAYSIGEFRKLLEPFGFFMTHKSHLINLRHIVRYHKNGTVLLKDQEWVPVSRRRRQDFLSQLNHL